MFDLETELETRSCAHSRDDDSEWIRSDDSRTQSAAERKGRSAPCSPSPTRLPSGGRLWSLWMAHPVPLKKDFIGYIRPTKRPALLWPYRAESSKWGLVRSSAFPEIPRVVGRVGTFCATSNIRPLAIERSLEERFREHADKWERETAFLSATPMRVLHDSYQSILAMGPEIVPVLLRDLQKTRRHWFWALRHLTNADPVAEKDRGNADKMIAAWVQWGKREGKI
jgi:hypothetical protein